MYTAALSPALQQVAEHGNKKVIGAIVSNIVSSVMLILVMKKLMSEFRFSYVMTICGLHFLVGGLALLLA